MQCPRGRIAAINGTELQDGVIRGYWCTQGCTTRTGSGYRFVSTDRKWMPCFDRTTARCREFNPEDYPTLNPLFEEMKEK